MRTTAGIELGTGLYVLSRIIQNDGNVGLIPLLAIVGVPNLEVSKVRSVIQSLDVPSKLRGLYAISVIYARTVVVPLSVRRSSILVGPLNFPRVILVSPAIVPAVMTGGDGIATVTVSSEAGLLSMVLNAAEKQLAVGVVRRYGGNGYRSLGLGGLGLGGLRLGGLGLGGLGLG